jgi:TetR/AcrR family transcriptional regulator
LLQDYFKFLDENPEFVRMLLWENLEKSRRSAGRQQNLSKNPFLERFREVVESGVREGQFRADVNVPHLVVHFIGLCFIYHSNRFSLSQSLSLDLSDAKVKAEGLKQVLALVFEGIDKK